jgi:hypothetical protein
MAVPGCSDTQPVQARPSEALLIGACQASARTVVLGTRRASTPRKVLSVVYKKERQDFLRIDRPSRDAGRRTDVSWTF